MEADIFGEDEGAAALQAFYDAGLLVKMTGDVILLAPPLVCEESHIDEMVGKLRQALQTM